MSARVAVNIVSYDSDKYLESCLESLKVQSYRNFSIALWDNASKDRTRAIIQAYRNSIAFIHFSEQNVGFCQAHNRLIQASDADYVLALNPDVILDPEFLARIAGAMNSHPQAGSATGKLLRQPAAQNPACSSSDEKILDSTGMYFTPTQRHFDRGSSEIDRGQYERPEYVFGASGAAALYRRSMLEDICFESEYFDESFFAYREDADLAWRALWLGWRCIYVPEAVAYHARRVLPSNRSTLPDNINTHSFKNRFLLRAKNMDAGTWMRFIIPITTRDLAALLYILVRERSSLRALPELMRLLPRARAWRRFIQSKKRVPAAEIRNWFSYKPVSRPLK